MHEGEESQREGIRDPMSEIEWLGPDKQVRMNQDGIEGLEMILSVVESEAGDSLHQRGYFN